jgi:uncharacterized protein YndB with AHSA1/START domain
MIDVVQQINAVPRQVGSRVLEAGELRTVSISQTYETTVDDLWDACTNAQRIPRWFLPISGDLRVGGRYQLEGNAGGTIEWCDPPRGFRATWEYGEGISWIEVRLTDQPDGRACLELEHIVPVDAHWLEFGPGAVGVGWDLALLGMTLHLGSGRAVDPSTVAAWNASTDGQRFMALSSEHWRAANVAAGNETTCRSSTRPARRYCCTVDAPPPSLTSSSPRRRTPARARHRCPRRRSGTSCRLPS